MKIYPASYAVWLESRLSEVPTEKLATCATCAMVKPKGQTRDRGPFLNHLKCCTYFPFVPNFSLGSIAQDPLSWASNKAVGSASERGIYLPLGLFPSAEHQTLTEQIGENGFGQRSELLCPFFDSEKHGCSIWASRPGVCATYFCKSNRGAQGLAFWRNVEDYLNHFEWKLACEVMSRIGLGENEIAFSQSAISQETDEAERAYFVDAAWSQWAEKKWEFYRLATSISLSIGSEEIGRLLDTDFLDLEKELNQAKT